jgi:hypothetical protein
MRRTLGTDAIAPQLDGQKAWRSAVCRASLMTFSFKGNSDILELCSLANVKRDLCIVINARFLSKDELMNTLRLCETHR